MPRGKKIAEGSAISPVKTRRRTVANVNKPTVQKVPQTNKRRLDPNEEINEQGPLRGGETSSKKLKEPSKSKTETSSQFVEGDQLIDMTVDADDSFYQFEYDNEEEDCEEDEVQFRDETGNRTWQSGHRPEDDADTIVHEDSDVNWQTQGRSGLPSNRSSLADE